MRVHVSTGGDLLSSKRGHGAPFVFVFSFSDDDVVDVFAVIWF